MDARDLLGRLPEPDPSALPRIWRRFEETRAGARGRSRTAFAIGLGGALVAAAALVWVGRPEAERRLDLASDGERALAWSDTTALAFAGRGAVRGRARDVVVDWDAGTLQVDVVPDSGTTLAVVTEEGTVRIVGTAFSVRRDALGTTIAVTHGRVALACADGSARELRAEDGGHTCLPVRAAGLLGRADALSEARAPAEQVLAALELGLEAAEPGSAVESELLARRVRYRGEVGRVEDALADAERYLASGATGRSAEVRRAAARIALRGGGCARALPYLEALGDAATAEDRVVLASCVAVSEPARAGRLATEALASGEPIDPAWRSWAEGLVGGGR